MTTLSEAAKHLAQAKSKPGESNPDGAIETATEPGRRRLSVGYSRFVSIMKFALPATALALIVLIFLWPQIRMVDTRFNIGFARLKATKSEDPSMVNARYVGTDKNNQPFSITADLAKDLLSGSAAIELEMPKADLALKNGTWLALTANSGVYNQKKKQLDLQGAVNLFHDSGYEFKTSKLSIDLDAGRAQSDQKVRGQGPFGQLQAEGFHLVNGGKSIFFTGKAKLIISPKAAGSTK